MARFASNRQFRGRSPRRTVGWGIGPGSSAATALSASGQSILGSGLIVGEVAKVTVVRLRGNLQAYLTATAAANDGFHCAVGIGIVTNEAFAIGPTALPGPLSEADWDGWFYHRIFDLHQGAENAVNTALLDAVQFEVDSKAMRKWDGGAETMVAMVEVSEIGTSVMTIYFDTRVLIKGS